MIIIPTDWQTTPTVAISDQHGTCWRYCSAAPLALPLQFPRSTQTPAYSVSINEIRYQQEAHLLRKTPQHSYTAGNVVVTELQRTRAAAVLWKMRLSEVQANAKIFREAAYTRDQQTMARGQHLSRGFILSGHQRCMNRFNQQPISYNVTENF